MAMAEKIKTSISIDGDLWKETQKAAIDLGKDASELTAQALRHELDALKGKKAPPVRMG